MHHDTAQRDVTPERDDPPGRDINPERDASVGRDPGGRPMSRTDHGGGPAHVPVWVIRFNEALERIYLVLRVNAAWLVLTLLGLVVLGVAPASCAAADAYISGREGDRVRVWRTMWTSYRSQFVRANTRMLPLLVVQGGALMMLWIVMGGGAARQAMTVVLACVAVISLFWATVSASALAAVPRVRRQDLLVSWRISLLIPGALPLRSVGLGLLLLVWVLLCWALWPVGLLLGAGTAVDIAVSLLGRRGERLLDELDRASAAAGG